MTIIDNRKPATVEFGNIQVGECFIDVEMDSLCIKIELCVNEEDEDVNAIILHNGAHCWFDSKEQVIKTNAHIVIS